MPVLLFARPPLDAAEERTIRKLAGARHAPGDWIRRARMIAHSWDGLGTTQIADQLGCHPRRCESGCTGSTPKASTGSATGQAPADRGGSARPSVAGSSPWPARRRPAGCTKAVRGCWPPPSPRRRRTGPWTPSPRPPRPRASGWAAARSAASCLPKGRAGGGPAPGPPAPTRVRPKRAQVIALYTAPPPEVTVVCADELGPVIPRSFPPAPGWTPDGHRVKALLDYGRGPEQDLGGRRAPCR